CKVTYSALPDNTWTIDYEATADKPTVINLTHHTYWNLAGEASGNVLGQELQVFADRWTKTDDGLIPITHEPVKGTGFDFTEMRTIGAKADWMAAQAWLKCTDNWYDHNFVLNGKLGELHPAATMRDPVSGRRLEIWTTEPCMQMYGAQNMDGTLAAKAAGAKYPQFAGVALETQHAPDSPNHAASADWPTTVLRPGETFRSRTEYRFTAE
ncbi:MAG: galactose mutarotase, partial [bacterium]|nr:galactose mutarotase [Candidatus Colisoma equi]